MRNDLSLEELRAYLPPREEPPDFDAFWQDTLAEAQSFPLNATFTPVDYGLKTVEVFDVRFSGYGGPPIKGWMMLPHQRQGHCHAWSSSPARPPRCSPHTITLPG